MGVRSRRLGTCVVPAGGGLELIYTCPADRTAIVKDIRVRSLGSGGDGFMYVQVAGGNAYTIAQWAFSATTSWVPPSPPWVVLEEGDELWLYTTAAAQTITAYVSGTELLGDPA